MKRFYIVVLLFMLPIFVFMGGAEYAVRQIPNEYKYKNDWMDQHAEEVETLILGNSHTQVGLNPALMGNNVFNLSIAGQDYLYSHFLFFKWVNRLNKLKIVILPISYFSFYEDIQGDNSKIMQELGYRIYMDCPYRKYDIAYNFESLYFKPLLSKFEKYYNGEIINWDSCGWVPWLKVNKSPVWNANHVNKALARLYLSHSFENVLENYGLVENIACYCNRHDIKFVLVSSPQTKEYNSCLSKEQVEETRNLIKKLQRHYNVKYYDFREDCRYKDDDFFDQSHLSEIGAEKFTNSLVAILLREVFPN